MNSFKTTLVPKSYMCRSF